MLRKRQNLDPGTTQNQFSVRIETSVVDITCDWAIQVFTDCIHIVVLPTTKLLRIIQAKDLEVPSQM
jgi:hypothetical protein